MKPLTVQSPFTKIKIEHKLAAKYKRKGHKHRKQVLTFILTFLRKNPEAHENFIKE